MGCLISTARDGGGNRRRPGNVGEIAVFVPGLRIPKAVDFLQSLGNCLPKSLVDRLTALRTRIVVMAGQEVPTATKSRRKTATRHGDSTLADLQLALEEYLPVLLGLVQDGNQLEHMINFCWVNQEDDSEETALPNAWYEVLSVLHLMAMLSLSQANLLLLPKTSTAGYQPKVSDECRRISIDIFLKAAGYLDCAIRNVLPKMPPELRTKLPVDLSEGVLQALCLQALGQSGDIHLGMAIDSAKATLAVKRRLACEMVKYWHQAHESIMNLRLANGWGEKHRLFVKWKYTEAKAAAYYFHGLILDEGNTEKSHGMAVAALQAAEEFLKESKKACEAFNTAPPTSRSARVRCGEELQMLIVGFGTDLALKINRSSESEPPPEYADRYPPLWGTMKYLSEKIPKDASSRERINRDLYSQEKIIQTAPALPDFAVALKPDDYILPEVDPSWNNCPKSQLGGPLLEQLPQISI